MRSRVGVLSVSIALLTWLAGSGWAGDWPMWRYDAARTAASSADLPDELDLIWVREYPARVQAWEDPLNQDLMPYDKVLEPVILGKILFLVFNDTDKIVAYDTDTGEERWSFYAEAPIRLPPVADDGRVYFCSDDGFLYCNAAESGELRWKVRGGPENRRILGNSRLISMWPARGGPVLQDGTVYFAASIWPFMGTFVYAVDAESGNIIWLNDGTGADYRQQPHGGSESFGSVAPQGSLTVAGDTLLVPGGRSVPAAFDRADGRFLYYKVADYSKVGGSFVCANENVFFSHTREKRVASYLVESGHKLESLDIRGKQPVIDSDFAYFYGGKGEGLTCLRMDPAKALRAGMKPQDLVAWKLPLEASGGDLIKAGRRLYSCGGHSVAAVDLPLGDDNPSIAWTKTVDGTAERIVAADGKLFVVTLEGKLYCFGTGQGQPARHTLQQTEVPPAPESLQREADDLLRGAGGDGGYCVILGIEQDDLLIELARRPGLRVIAVDPDANKVDALRRRFDSLDLYGKKLQVLEGDPATFPLPPYCARLALVKSDLWTRGEALARQIFRVLRPYGGSAFCRGLTPEAQKECLALIEAADLSGANAKLENGHLILYREGPLPGSAPWTHQYGDIANSVKSDDQLVRLPLGILWFGGSSNMDVLPRHAHGPAPQVIGGRLFIQGIDCMSARDVYTGQVLWKTEMKLGTYDVYYDSSYANTPTSTSYNQNHIPGANARGTNFVATEQYVYVARDSSCQVLSAATGETIRTFSLSAVEGGDAPEWGYIGVCGDALIAGAGFVPFRGLAAVEAASDEKKKEKPLAPVFDQTASRELIVMDRESGKERWRRSAEHGFLHNAIVAGDGLLYCLDRVPPHIADLAARRGHKPAGDYRLLALSLIDGRVVWETQEGIFGTWLGYSEEHGILLQAGRPSRDMIPGEVKARIIAYSAADGKVLWDAPHSYQNPLMLHHARIITDRSMIDLVTGEQMEVFDPVTGAPVPWTFSRRYGCNYCTASEHLLTFRSGAAGFYDLANYGGTGNFGGFKSGCTSNLIAADGVLSAPDYTRTCSCSYQNQTSLALIHMPDVEIWTTHAGKSGDGPVHRLGINLGAPGNRRDDDGTYWIEFPDADAPSPPVEVRVRPEQPNWFRKHASRVSAESNGWIYASGAEGLLATEIVLGSQAKPEQSYLVRLHFIEPDDSVQPGERVFSVQLQGRDVLSGFDVVKEAGGPMRAVTRSFSNVPAADVLAMSFIAAPDAKRQPVLCGVSVLAERMKLEGGYDGPVRFQAPPHFRLGEPFTISGVTLRSGMTTGGNVFYRFERDTEFTRLPLGPTGDGVFAALMPKELARMPFDYYLEMTSQDRQPVRVPPSGTHFLAVPDASPPTAVEAFQGVGNHDAIDLSWRPAQDDDRVVAYQLFLQTDDGDERKIAELSADTLSYRHDKVVPGRMQRYLIRATDKVGRVGPSAALEILVPENE